MNTLFDFPADQFRILGACDSCDHAEWLNQGKLPDEMRIDVLRKRVTCQACSSRDCGIRIMYDPRIALLFGCAGQFAMQCHLRKWISQP